MAKPTKNIPEFKGQAAKWLTRYLESPGHQRTAEQARRDKEEAARIQPLQKSS